MAQPTPYNKATNFEDYAVANPNAEYNAPDHDSEFDAIETTLDVLLTNLAILQRDDTALANGIVTPDSLSAASLALMGGSWSPEGDWATATEYAVGDVVEESGNGYVCAAAHTSGTFATDDAAGYWIPLGTSTATAYSGTDANFSITGSEDATKIMKFDVDELVTTATTRTYKAPDANGTLALLELAQTFTATQTFDADVVIGGADGADTLTHYAATVTIGNNVTATRAMGTLASGGSAIGHTGVTTYVGHSGGTSDVRARSSTITGSGANAVTAQAHDYLASAWGGSAALTTLYGQQIATSITSSGAATTVIGLEIGHTSSAAGTNTTLSGVKIIAPTYSSTGTTTNLYALHVLNQGNSKVTNAYGLYIEDFSGSTTMRGIRSALSSGSGKHNLYIDGTAVNHIAGALALGTTTQTGVQLSVGETMTSTAAIEQASYYETTFNEASGAFAKYGINHVSILGAALAGTGLKAGIRSTISAANAITQTGVVAGFSAGFSSAAAASLSFITGYHVETIANSGSATVSVMTGVNVEAQTVGTNIYGLRSQIAASAFQRWNLFCDGTAPNKINGSLYINDALHTNVEMGLVINQGTSGSIAIALKNSNVTHGLTTVTIGDDVETDDYFSIGTYSNTTGGVYIQSMIENTVGVSLMWESWCGAPSTTDTSASLAAMNFFGGQHDGANGDDDMAADSNLFAVGEIDATGSRLTRLLLKADDGELHLGNSTPVALDDEDDALLVRALQKVGTREGIRETQWDNPFYNYDKLRAAGLVGERDHEGFFLFPLQARLAVHEGAIWQGYVRQKEQEESIESLRARVNDLETRNRALEARINTMH